MNTKTVTIPSCAEHEGFQWNTLQVTLNWVCPVCGGPRGEVYQAPSWDGSRRIIVDGWRNPCGHIDQYSAIRNEAKANGLNGADRLALTKIAEALRLAIAKIEYDRPEFFEEDETRLGWEANLNQIKEALRLADSLLAA